MVLGWLMRAHPQQCVHLVVGTRILRHSLRSLSQAMNSHLGIDYSRCPYSLLFVVPTGQSFQNNVYLHFNSNSSISFGEIFSLLYLCHRTFLPYQSLFSCYQEGQKTALSASVGKSVSKYTMYSMSANHDETPLRKGRTIRKIIMEMPVHLCCQHCHNFFVYFDCSLRKMCVKWPARQG